MTRRFKAQQYYDRFSLRYDAPRGRGYHHMIDTLQVESVLSLRSHRERFEDVLEVGCGTGLLLERMEAGCKRLVGLDLSAGMLQRATGRGHRVVQGSADFLPFADESFDLVYSFKVLAHVEAIESALAEMARVLKPGGSLVCDFYNPLSLRGLIKAIKPATAVAADATDHQVYTRYDTLSRFASYLPKTLTLADTRGVRVLTPWARLLDLPLATQAMIRLERWAGRAKFLARFGGFMVVVLRKNSRDGR